MDVKGAKTLVHLDLFCAPTAPALGREALRGIPEIEPVRQNALLIASELLTNAVNHSGAAATDTVQFEAALTVDALRISVRDAGFSPTSPHLRPLLDSQRQGYGLQFTEQLARDWGVDEHGGRLVWAELQLQP
ncbi:MAG: ATP-binding protein [Solirubrobacteraceae bacterium]